MTQITVNQKSFKSETTEFAKEATLNEVLDLILDEVGENEIITNIQINGQDIAIDEEEKYLAGQFQDYDKIDFTLQSSLELAYEALESCNSYIDVVIEKIQLMSDLYQSNKAGEANEIFGEVIEIMDLFVQLISKITKTIRTHLGEAFQKSNTIQKLEIHLLSVLKALVPAKEKDDIIMLCDLLEYELVDNLTQWKIKAIPELKNQKQA
ncbi:MAG: hypothetical protein HN509_00175 [Halobacteriovoraceae bacterium]|jgi:hypothetical protein|nr:hypothetical protein [Halobacteriovoraceae bacterium]MBT5095116.1 hypothetical protein [Halobacteriovoraceae bacterium]